MAYRGKRNFTRRVPDEDSGDYDYSSPQSEDDHDDHQKNDRKEYEEDTRRSQNPLPTINKEKDARKIKEQQRFLASNDSKIPGARRGVSQRLPNSKREDLVTPVRERFRARYRVEQDTSTTNKEREKLNKKRVTGNNNDNTSKRVTFYRNGDKHFKGRPFIITKQRYRSFDNLFEDLSRAIPLPYGVRNIFSPNGRIINSINELEDGGSYICSSGDQLIRNINYNSKAKSEVPSEGIQKLKLSVPSDTSSNSSSPRNNNKTPKPRVVTIINRERDLKCKLLLNRKTVKSFEDVLRDVSEMMKLQGEFVKELHSSQKGSKVGGLSEMFNADDDVYTAIIVQDRSTKRNLSNPSSHSSNGGRPSPSSTGRKIQKSRKKQRRDLGAGHERGVTIKVKDKKLTFYPPSKRDAMLEDTEDIFSLPGSRPQLNWVYGYQGKDTRFNLHVLPSGELLYFVTRVVVIYNRKNNTQRHYTEHADDIKCIAVHPNQWYIATGQTSGLSLDQNDLSHVRIWDSETLLTLAVLQFDDYSLSAIAMAFSVEDNGDVLSCIDSSGDSYRLSLWEWKDKKCLAQSKEFPSVALAVMFDPDDSKTIVSCGKENIFFWRWHNGKLERKNGFFESNPVPVYVTCLDFAPNGDVFTGDSNGSITAWSKVSKKVKFVVRNAHEKSILSLHVLDSGLLLTAGGMDSRVRAWDANKYFNLPLREIQLPELTGVSALKPLQTGETDVTLLAGTTANSILEGSFMKPFTTIVKGNKLDVPAFAVHPSRGLFVMASLDKTATLWSAVNHETIWSVDVEFPIRVAAFYPTGSVIAFGTTQGRWIILNAESGMHQASFQDGIEPITDLEYSPDGEHIAVGSKDGNIYVHAVYDDGMTYRRVGCCSNHTAPVLFLDWSVDGCFVQSMSTEYDIITWEIGAFAKEESQNIIRDTEWNTRNVVLGYDVVGVWQSTPTDGNLVTSSDLAWSHDLLAIGDELGYMRIFRYPCSYQGVQYHQVRAHSSTVLRVMFLSSDKFLLSTAGQDCAVFQWSMEGMVEPLTKKTKKQKSENIKVVVSNSDIEDGESYSSKEHSERPLDEMMDVFDDERDGREGKNPQKGRRQKFEDLENGERDTKTKSDSSTNRGRNRKPNFEVSDERQRFDKNENNGENNKNKFDSNSIRGRSRKPDSEVSDETQVETSEDSSEDYRRQYEDQKPRGKEEKSVRGRRGRPSNQRSFEEDMYRDKGDTSDDRKGRILRGRAKRYAEDDVSMEEDSDDDVIPRRTKSKSKQNGYRRAKSPAREREGKRHVGESDEYSDTARDVRNNYRNNRYGGKRNYRNDRDQGQGYYSRNKR